MSGLGASVWWLVAGNFRQATNGSPLYYRSVLQLSLQRLLPIVILLTQMGRASGAIISGTVTDASNKPLENVRIDHTGTMVIVVATELATKPSSDEIRTDTDGHFRVETGAAAIVVRKPG